MEKGHTTGNHPYYTFYFDTPTGGKWNKRFMVWLCPPILKALGCKETKPGVFDWDTDEVEGRAIEADSVIETVKGKEYTTIINIEPATADREAGDDDEFGAGPADPPEFDTPV
ncbi:MAG: hypothetical protein FP827_02280 [Candidatus Omnitrophica bacterium]|nr:hypothetical protein [Candidatus Omnitrophota bacterium]